MKKIITILCTAALLSSLTGCNSAEKPDTSGDSQLSSPVSDSNDSIDNSDGSGSSEIPGGSDNSDNVPEKPKPDGEPTFLIGPDGEPIYTSEITKITARDPETYERVSVDTLDRSTFETVVCDGFTYVYMPRFSVNCLEDPELFEDIEFQGRHYYNYIGGELDDNVEFSRAYPGDKFGDLTLKSARIVFTNSDEFGVVAAGGNMEFEGEIELTGYVTVTKYDETELYPVKGGEIEFYPDNASAMKLPVMGWAHDKGNKTIRYDSIENVCGLYGDGGSIRLGNLSDIECDLQEGDEYVRVKVRIRHVQIGIGRLATALDIKLI